jgi:biopolymer transport protein ExbD
MNFRPRAKNKPELNLIPMIDVLIVLLIFLVLTTTFSREGAMRVNLPQASSQVTEKDKGIVLVVKADGRYAVNGHVLASTQLETLKQALREAAGENKDPLLTINADKLAQHQFVIGAMNAASALGFVHISFGTTPVLP